MYVDCVLHMYVDTVTAVTATVTPVIPPGM